MSNPRISVVVNTLNEERRLAYSLRSVKGWTDEIVVVDMQSDDRTASIAHGFGARVISTERAGFVEPARNLGMMAATGEWILVLDADEIIPEPLSRVLRRIATEDQADAVVIPWLNYFLGATMMHTGWGPKQDKHVRFFRRGWASTSPEIHRAILPRPGARIVELPYTEGLAVAHFSYSGIEQFLDKANSYTTIQAQQREALPSTVTPRLVPLLGGLVVIFLDRYFLSGGYRDGWRGFTLSVMMAMYDFVASTKAIQLRYVGTDAQIEASYRERAEQLLRSYER